jgi:pyruvate,orthophosphate dikinase
MSADAVVATKWVYDSSEGSAQMRDLLGGKGANLAEMTRVLGPEVVPRGFTVTTEACVAYMREGELPPGLADQVAAAMGRLEEQTGKRFGDADDPLLVSVRSGARVSMPGMLDTVLNLGLEPAAVAGLARRSGSERFALDCYRRLLQMFGNVVRGIDSAVYEDEIEALKKARGVALDTELDADDLGELAQRFERLFEERTGEPFPADPQRQLRDAIVAVFESWNGDRAVEYRRQNRIPDEWGTAVNVEQMVYGNRGSGSGSGVAFSRNEITGEPRPSGDFLLDAQGEDVVSGVRNTQSLDDLAELMPDVHGRLIEVLRTLEAHFGDMQDIEFTVEEGRLYILQARGAKRPAAAAMRFAVDAVNEGLLDRARAIATLDADRVEAMLHPTFDPAATFGVLTTGVAASPGGAGGEIVFTAEAAVAAAKRGADAILVRPFTEADDVAGFEAARGILTSEGGKASHAALVARGMGRPCVCGASELEIDLERERVRVGETELRAGDWIGIEGSTGKVTTDRVPLIRPQPSAEFEQVLAWADELRRLGVHANADTPDDARRARELGAAGVGLCRTEHMFMAADRQPLMRRMILARGAEERAAALRALEPLQQGDFEGIFSAMAGLPVTVRLLDPPLHEFLPDRAELMLEIERLAQDGGERLAEARRELDRVNELSETNPMLGTRGCRLGIEIPEIYEMQVRAIVRAGLAVRDREGEPPLVEIMVPLVDYPSELARVRDLIERTAAAVFAEDGAEPLALRIGTMIELPRACLVAGEIAAGAEFFSFGTNDLTQTALGFSRDDAEGGFLAGYLEKRIVDASPFGSIDEAGVGELVRIAVERGRAAKPELTLGICGEHGGDPRSIRFFDRVGLDYVSCSPYRVPVARIAAAQAAIESQSSSTARSTAGESPAPASNRSPSIP